jgi:ABC-type transporter lipoprotein component MlaA
LPSAKETREEEKNRGSVRKFKTVRKLFFSSSERNIKAKRKQEESKEKNLKAENNNNKGEE